MARHHLRHFPVVAALLSLLCVVGPEAAQATPEGFQEVDVAVSGRRAATIKVYVRWPQGAPAGHAVPVVIGLHGCGGLFRKDGRLNSRHEDWATRWSAAGYAVVLPDSFNPRGVRQICTLGAGDRPILARDRAEDALAVAAWLKTQPLADSRRIALVGWSNGGSTVLNTVGIERARRDAAFVAAIAFYPGCRPLLRRQSWAPLVPLTILMGDADNWTSPQPCRDLAAAHGIRLITYPGAVHGFDAPHSKVRTRSGVGFSASGDGRVKTGTDPEARAASIGVVTDILAKAFAAK